MSTITKVKATKIGVFLKDWLKQNKVYPVIEETNTGYLIDINFDNEEESRVMHFGKGHFKITDENTAKELQELEALEELEAKKLAAEKLAAKEKKAAEKLEAEAKAEAAEKLEAKSKAAKKKVNNSNFLKTSNVKKVISKNKRK